MKSKKIAQIGTFDVENFGDLLFPDVLKNKLGKEYMIDLFSPNGGIKPFDQNYVFSIETLEERIQSQKYDAIVIGGGDIIRTDCKICIRNDTYGYSSEPSLELWVYPILLAKKYGIPVVFNAVGVTNNFTDDEIFIVKEILNYVDYFTVRDIESQKTLERIGIFNSKIVPDTVLTIKDLYSEEELDKEYTSLIKNQTIPDLKNYIIFQHNVTNIDNQKYFNNIIKLINTVSKKNKVLLMPIGYIHDDDKILNKIYNENMSNVYIVNLEKKLTPKQMISIIKNSDGYIGTSMHGAVVSYAYSKKIMILNSMNSKKLHGFANIINKNILDVNEDDMLLYIYNNYFENQDIRYDKKIYNKIQEHFLEIKNIIQNCKKVSDANINIKKIVTKFYKDKNDPEIIGEFYDDENGYLNRQIFKYKKNEKNIYCAIIKSNSQKVFLKPVINMLCKPIKININDNNYCQTIGKIISEDTLLEIENKKGTIEIELDIDIFNTQMVKRVLLNELNISKQLEKDLNKQNNINRDLLSSYQELEKKYCNLIKNKISRNDKSQK